jgi:hypothetical protein
VTETTRDDEFPEPSDGVEIKFSFSGGHVPDVLDAFDLREESAERMRIYFFDALVADGAEPRLRLLTAAMILRLRHVVDGPDNSTLKLRPAVADRLTGPWRAGSPHDDDYRVEYDWGTRRVLAASLERRVAADDIEEVVAGRRPLRKAFSDEQESLLEDCGPELAHPFDGLDVAGPITALRWRELEVEAFSGGGGVGGEKKEKKKRRGPLPRAERWDYEGGRSFVELSVRVKNPHKAPERRAELVDLLERRRLVPDRGATKTETVLRDLLS